MRGARVTTSYYDADWNPIPEFNEMKKTPKSPTDFQMQVYNTISLIPAGKVSTYGALAATLHSSPRAVGQALRCNPYAPKVPCHRIIAATLDLGGFTGSWGINCESVQKKKAMLEKEGLAFTDKGKLQTANAVLDADDMTDLINNAKIAK